MSEWRSGKLSDLIARHTGGGTPARSIEAYWNGDIPWASVKDFCAGQKTLITTQESITAKGLQASASNLIPANTLLICSRMAVGRVAITAQPTAINQDVKALFAAEGVSAGYLYYLLSHCENHFASIAVGSTVKGISTSQILDKPVMFPESRAARDKIAQILDSLDTAIHETEAIIVKLQAVKQGLLHDLLTRGLDASGQLRPPPALAPELYQDSPLGLIPREWEVVEIGDIAQSSIIGPFGSDLLASDYKSEGIPVVFVRDIRATGFTWNSDTYVSPEKGTQLSAHSVKAGDVLATKMGLPPCLAAVYPEWMPPGIITADIIRFRFDASQYRPTWIAYGINDHSCMKQVEAITAGVTRPKVTLSDARKLKLRLAPLHEQDRILAAIGSHEAKIREETALQEKLLLQKVGLMDDLLTGCVRVKVLDTEMA